MALKRVWRVTAAGFSYLLFGLGSSIPAVVSLVLLLLPIASDHRRRITRGVIRRLCLFYIHLMQSLGLYSYQLHNRAAATVEGHLIVANHPMLIDALFVMAYVRNVCCIVKPALARNPFTRLTVRAAGFIVASDENLLEQACTALARGENLLIFPEGTRNEYDTQLAFRRGAANIAVIANCPILPVVFYCHPRMLQKGEPWHQLPDNPAHIVMLIEPSLRVGECIDTLAPRTRQYRTLTQYLKDYYLQRLQNPPTKA